MLWVFNIRAQGTYHLVLRGIMGAVTEIRRFFNFGTYSAGSGKSYCKPQYNDGFEFQSWTADLMDFIFALGMPLRGVLAPCTTYHNSRVETSVSHSHTAHATPCVTLVKLLSARYWADSCDTLCIKLLLAACPSHSCWAFSFSLLSWCS